MVLQDAHIFRRKSDKPTGIRNHADGQITDGQMADQQTDHLISQYSVEFLVVQRREPIEADVLILSEGVADEGRHGGCHLLGPARTHDTQRHAHAEQRM